MRTRSLGYEDITEQEAAAPALFFASAVWLIILLAAYIPLPPPAAEGWEYFTAHEVHGTQTALESRE